MSISNFCLFLIFLSIFSYIESDELQILLKLKTALQGSNTNAFSSWTSNNHLCNFTRITCNSDESVKEIELSNQNLAGVLPIDSLCQLQALEKLSFGFNYLSGIISEDLNNCIRLQYLDLGNNLFTGSFPRISSLSDLRYLYLNNSGYSRAFPWTSLENMTNLVSLSLGDNNFTPTPFPNQVVKLTKLNWLYLSNCSLEGQIPAEIGNLTELINLELSTNRLSGSIPAEIGKLQKLWQLELWTNRLTGKLPIGLRNLTNLENFDASDNFLEGDTSEVRFLTNLVSLQLYENQFSGEVPAELGQFQKLVNLSLFSNNLIGIFPAGIWGLPKLMVLDIAHNQIEGPITRDIENAKALKYLLAGNNRLSGELPEQILKATSLVSIKLSKNRFSGEIPAFIRN